MERLIECVPNFSEGRDLAKIDAIADTMRGVPGVWLLDRHSDTDHNRTVITLAGEPGAVAEAAIRSVGRAAQLIDLTKHSGVHPRLGATDVVPFVPFDGHAAVDCVEIAHRVGQEIWKQHRIPVYFYEAAALRPEHKNLEKIRRGGFEALLKTDFSLYPERAPDVGGPKMHPTAGAIAIGVRNFLIAFNINLATTDLSVAQRIARAIRASHGGLLGVKAMGVALASRGLTQVSMNVTNFELSPLDMVFRAVEREAQREGCKIIGSEIVGLVPRKAIEMITDFDLQLETLAAGKILEDRLAAARAT
jgi:glutamate formiminotransferase